MQCPLTDLRRANGISNIIRPSEPDDCKQWKILWHGYNKFCGRTNSTALSDEIVNSTWRRFHEEAEPLYCLLAEDGERSVGLAHFIFSPQYHNPCLWCVRGSPTPIYGHLH